MPRIASVLSHRATFAADRAVLTRLQLHFAHPRITTGQPASLKLLPPCHFAKLPASSTIGHDMSEYRPTIAITMGDPAGIGAEVIVKALSDPLLRARARFIIFGMNEMLHYAADLAEINVFWWRDQFNNAVRRYELDVVVLDYDEYSILSNALHMPSQVGGEASMRFCLDAIDAAKAHTVDAVVTAPIAKESWKLAGFKYPGHTELFAEKTGTRTYAIENEPGRS